MNKTTINDVAKYANTTRSTVSRVLNNSPLVNPRTREKVLEAIDVLRYTPNKTARSLKSGKSHVLGLVYSQQQISEVLMNPGVPGMIKSISERAQSEGYNILLITSAGVDYKSYDDLIMKHSVDGFIVSGAMIHDSLHEVLDKAKIPYVYNMKYSESKDDCYVTFDDVEGGYLAAKYLLDLGHRDIKLIVGDVKGTVLSFNHSRIAGFKKALQEYEIPFVDSMVLRTPGDMDSSYHFIASLFARERPTALLLSNEVTSTAALNALIDKGFSIPDDVSLVAFGYPDFFRYTRPSLTTVGLDIVWQGNHLVDMLLQRINDPGSTPAAMIKKPELVVRESTKKAP
ncbi:MAG TPA: LacI family DNA-binding transcriptional regulator [Paenibacillus sp.]|uniref:LacI family DNA-binding transcriptional regulator n=1 Tax=Paenibacillus sp. TaxID=58172 RepID=UPI002B726EB1|nr:LacI family DNA-binding transcriptional regulator [Paenibacillus sp.]HUC94186.1 LacI family DNA-binding transcriptional regulator [Paenibacillus sp.]